MAPSKHQLSTSMTYEDVIRRYIEPSPRHPGLDDMRLRDYGVSVWALVAYQQATHQTVDEVADAYNVPPEAVQAAFQYYQRHKTLIDARIAANAPVDDEAWPPTGNTDGVGP